MAISQSTLLGAFTGNETDGYQIVRRSLKRYASPSSLSGTRKGNWTKSEHELFLNVWQLNRRGPWRRIAQDIPTRNERQVKTHAQKYIRLIQSSRPDEGDTTSSVSAASLPTSSSPCTPRPAAAVQPPLAEGFTGDLSLAFLRNPTIAPATGDTLVERNERKRKRNGPSPLPDNQRCPFTMEERELIMNRFASELSCPQSSIARDIQTSTTRLVAPDTNRARVQHVRDEDRHGTSNGPLMMHGSLPLARGDATVGPSSPGEFGGLMLGGYAERERMPEALPTQSLTAMDATARDASPQLSNDSTIAAELCRVLKDMDNKAPSSFLTVMSSAHASASCQLPASENLDDIIRAALIGVPPGSLESGSDCSSTSATASPQDWFDQEPRGEDRHPGNQSLATLVPPLPRVFEATLTPELSAQHIGVGTMDEAVQRHKSGATSPPLTPVESTALSGSPLVIVTGIPNNDEEVEDTIVDVGVLDSPVVDDETLNEILREEGVPLWS